MYVSFIAYYYYYYYYYYYSVVIIVIDIISNIIIIIIIVIIIIIIRMLKDQKIMEKYFCALELYYNLTPAELICHLRAYLRKDNSCKNGSKGIIFTVFKRRQKAYCDKHRDLGKVK